MRHLLLIKDIEENYSFEQKLILQCIAGTYDNSNRQLLNQIYFQALKLRHNNIMVYLNQYIPAHELLEIEDILPLMSESLRDGQQKVLNDLSNNSINTFNVQITPLIGAMITNNIPMVTFFLENNKQCISITDYPTQGTPLTWSIEFGNRAITKLLLSYGADANIPNSIGVTPLAITIGRDQELVQELIEGGANVNTKSGIAPSPFFSVVIHGNINLISLFLKYGADVYDRNQNDNSTALVLAIKRHIGVINYIRNLIKNTGIKININGKISTLKEIIILLLNHGADINAQDIEGNTALMYAAHLGFTEIVQLLIDNGADLTITNNQGKTALDYARQENYQNIVNILENLLSNYNY